MGNMDQFNWETGEDPIAEETSELMKGLTVKRLKNFLEYLQRRDVPEKEKSYNTREWLIKLIYG